MTSIYNLLYPGSGKDADHIFSNMAGGTPSDKPENQFSVPEGFRLYRGDEGIEVKGIQAALIKLKYSCGEHGVDGHFGKDTEAAVRQFQIDNGIAPTGFVDVNTLILLNKMSGGEYEKEINKDKSNNGGGNKSNDPPTNSNKDSNDADTNTHCDNISEFKDEYGELIEDYAEELGIDPNALGAVILTESGGGGYYKNGSLKIRFENSTFIRTFDNYEYMNKYFTFIDEKGKRSKGHYYRTSTNDPWIDMHESEDQYITENGAFVFAQTLDSDAAYQSISMGLGQIMGFNYKDCGYTSAEEMYNAFSKSEEEQIKGMMNFIINYKDGVLLEALRKKDYVTFGTYYNGTALYGMKDNIDDYIEVN